MQYRRNEVTRVGAFGNKTVFVPVEGLGSQMGNAAALTMGMASGAVNATRLGKE